MTDNDAADPSSATEGIAMSETTTAAPALQNDVSDSSSPAPVVLIEEEEVAMEVDTSAPAAAWTPRYPSLMTPSLRWSPSALAFSNTTPWLARILFPTLCIATHCLFYYGQTAPMWKLRVFADIDVWANATDFTTKQTFNALGLKTEQHLHYEEDKDVQTFTYYYAIQHLWLAKGIPGKLLPRVAAVLLIVFSGVWPHLKLAWLQMTWFFSKQAAGRTTTLQWLSTLGKWSLADVLVVCVMVGVLNLDWDVNPDDIKIGIIEHLPTLLQLVESQYDETQLCDKFLKKKCEKARNTHTKAKCSVCTNVVHEAYNNPEWTQKTGKKLFDGIDTNGGGMATLRVVGMRGIYAFCGAVIVSILLSLMVDIFDHRAKQESRRHLERERALRPQRSDTGSAQPEDSMRRPLLDDDPDDIGEAEPLEVDLGGETDYSASTRRPNATLFTNKFLFTILASILVVLAAVDWDTMERKVFGAGPDLLHEILGVNWQRTYSLRELMWTTGAHGGWDNMLMGTFGLFCVLGPVIRGVLLLLVALLDRCRLPVEPVAHLINFLGAFCAWEVFAIAIIMVQMLMPSITNTIVKNKVCEKISEDGSCLQVEFRILPMTFWTVVAGGVALVAASCVTVRRGTDRSTPPPVQETARIHYSNDYQRLGGGFGEGGMEDIDDDGMEELVFETNDV